MTGQWTIREACAAMSACATAIRRLGGLSVLICLSASSVAACGPGVPLHAPAAGWTISFEDEFEGLSLFNGSSGRWEPRFPNGGRSIESNQELQLYVDEAYRGNSERPLGLNPFRVDRGMLTIKADRATPHLSSHLSGYKYTSGMLTTFRSFSQRYGYFEIRARLAEGRGLWPAFWLLPIDLSWPPEIDVLEATGHDTKTVYVAAHTNVTGRHSFRLFSVPVPGTTKQFNTYGAYWARDHIAWYVNGQRKACMATPGDMHQPMYMVMNLAVGGIMPGNPDQTTRFPAEMQIDYVRVYSTAD